MSIRGNQQRLTGADLGLRREEIRRQQPSGLHERIFRGVIVSAGTVTGYVVAVLQPNGAASVKQWDNVMPISGQVSGLTAGTAVLLVWREGHESPQIHLGSAGSGDGDSGFLFSILYFGG